MGCGRGSPAVLATVRSQCACCEQADAELSGRGGEAEKGKGSSRALWRPEKLGGEGQAALAVKECL